MSPSLFLVHGERYVGSVFELLNSEIEMKGNRLLDKIQKQLKLFGVSWLVSSFNNKLIGLKGLKVWLRERLRDLKLNFF